LPWSTTVAEILFSEPVLSSASSSTELPASAWIEGTRIVWPSSTRNCFPPAFITACDILIHLSDESGRRRKVGYYRQFKRARQPREGLTGFLRTDRIYSVNPE